MRPNGQKANQSWVCPLYMNEQSNKSKTHWPSEYRFEYFSVTGLIISLKQIFKSTLKKKHYFSSFFKNTGKSPVNYIPRIKQE